MEKSLNGYLEKIEKSLKPLPVSERVDIVKEIKSEILELQGDGKTPEEIVARLGDPKELAKAYLGDLIAKSGSRGWNRVLAICAYYSLASLSGLIVIPVLAICAPVFIVCAIATPILGAVKLVDALLRLDIWFDEKDPLIHIRTHNTALKKRLLDYSRRYPAICQQTDADPETGCMEFDIEKGRFSFRLTAPYSEERRQAASSYAKRNGIKKQK